VLRAFIEYHVHTSSFERLGVDDLAGLSGLGLFFV
jgi:hypothetical protein